MKTIHFISVAIIVLIVFSLKKQINLEGNYQSQIINNTTTMHIDSTMMNHHHKKMDNNKMYSYSMQPEIHVNKNDKFLIYLDPTTTKISKENK